MQKTELIAAVAKKSNVSQAVAATIVNGVLDTIAEALKSGEKVTLTGFGTFEARNTAARTGVNPRTKEKIQIAAGRRASFSAGSLLKSAVAPKAGGAKGKK